ncbi:hexosaminidase (plasmid) [Nitratiruptor sp. YY08-26]|uniref:hypothetical protein n=1 Tax=unclassified Nitratiruptor TaxID=2624044 RepID=UPI001915157B|nr:MULTISPECIES: hypothetical protein [unclassified Nitratiruptor]BCD63179.1 hexosaminidase [Nitratiruptor sp. YY08-13]BCD67115.1 hexosaminidase [Nitratiruptor sp. YY08-26]
MIFGNSKLFDRRWALLLFALVLWGWIGYSIFSHTTAKILKVTIIQSKTPVRFLDDRIVPIKKEVLWIDRLYFPRGNELRHPLYGYLGYTHDFVALFDGKFKLEKEIPVTFTIYSDDGFRLKIDGHTVMKYPNDRPFSKSERTVTLTPGVHSLHIKYFQGFGQLGIIGYYKTNRRHLIGQSSKDLQFLEQ